MILPADRVFRVKVQQNEDACSINIGLTCCPDLILPRRLWVTLSGGTGTCGCLNETFPVDFARTVGSGPAKVGQWEGVYGQSSGCGRAGTGGVTGERLPLATVAVGCADGQIAWVVNGGTVQTSSTPGDPPIVGCTWFTPTNSLATCDAARPVFASWSGVVVPPTSAGLSNCCAGTIDVTVSEDSP